MMFPLTACRRTRNGHLVARTCSGELHQSPIRHRYPAGVGVSVCSHHALAVLRHDGERRPGKAGIGNVPLAGLCKGVSIDLRIDGCSRASYPRMMPYLPDCAAVLHPAQPHRRLRFVPCRYV